MSSGTKGLAPGKPLARKTPLGQGGKGLAAGKPLARTNPAPRATPPAQRPRTPARNTGTTREVRAVVAARDGGLCVRCGAPATDQDHHRGRGAGGTKGAQSDRINQPAWILTLCGSGNTSGCHGLKEQNRHDAERDGYRIPRNSLDRDAQLVPVKTRAGWVLFDNEGGWTRVPEPPDGDARNIA